LTNRATRRGTPLGRLALALGAIALSSPAYAAGIDSHAYTCPQLQRLILSTGFVFIGNPNFADFVVANASYCPDLAQVQTRTVPTTDLPECPVNYCLPTRGGSAN